MLHKDFSLEVKEVSEAGVVEGYGSVFGGAPDSYGDIIMEGAYTGTIERHKKAGTMPLMLWGHQATELPIGDWLDMGEDKKGLWLKGQLDLEDPVGQRVHRALKRKSVRGLSIGYETLKAQPHATRKNVRELHEVELWEVSPVNFPAQRRAQITGVKALIEEGDQMPSVREFEAWLRDVAGFSKSKAVALASSCAPHLRGELEGEADKLAEFLQALR